MFGNGFDSVFGDIFGENYLAVQVEKLDDFWEHGKIQQYYKLLNSIKCDGRRVFRNEKTGKHIIR